MSSNYEEELKVIFQTYQIPLGAQGELRRLFKEVIEKINSNPGLMDLTKVVTTLTCLES